MNWSNIAIQVFDMAFLTLLIVFLWLIWRTSVHRNRALEKTLAEISFVNAEASRMNAEALRANAESLRKTVESVQNMVALLQQKET